ncbi:DJ-1/PfpI family protein [Methylobacterium oryzihabitans]|uniref:DJ-1/PfpI family protein n=1 Tax=Methylobacterium oryzihabitans TaxID=2499852 RepID=A0A3S2V7B3_9HYPH|nr:DJ-1/PfpI family protein [Methylobacterium oryzihabitans]RVU17383.1 DJ-1/PfpI family protein [Methylobacterium oryzihabitans]
MHVVMLVYPGLTQLDLTGPFEVLARVPELSLHLVARTLDPVRAGGGLSLLPTADFAGCPAADILFVPGGPGQIDLMEDAETLAFLRLQAAGASLVASVCTGSLVLAAAGLLAGHRATCHWLSLDQLAHFGVVPVRERVVADRDRITGAGVTAGLDLALAVVGRLFGDERARAVQLAMEYDPAPPYASGSPGRADPALVEAVRAKSAAFQAKRDAVARRVAETLLREERASRHVSEVAR